MVESSDRELELVCVVNHSFQIRNGITMGVDMNLATKRSSKSLPCDLAREILIQGLNTLGFGLGTPVILLLDQVSSLLKGVAELVAFTHAAERSLSNSAMNTLRVLTTCHLHVSPVSVWVSKQILGADFFTSIGFANGVLDDISLAADVVARPREDK
jgi:hypothetical protein